jgi:hypothetical protein
MIYVNTPSLPFGLRRASPPYIPPLTTPHGASWSPRRFTGLDGPDEASIPADAPTRAPGPGVSVIGGSA